MAQNEVYKDFDEAWSDVNDQPIKVKIGGKTYDLPSSVSAQFMLEVTRISANNPSASELTMADMGRLVSALFGKSTMDEWLDNGMSLNQLNDVMMFVLDKYGLVGGDADPKVIQQSTEQNKKSDKAK